MALRVLLIVSIQLVHMAALAQDSTKVSPSDSTRSPGERYIESINAGFRPDPEFERVDALEKQGMIDETFKLLTEIINRDSKLFPSPRREGFVKGVAFFKRGQMRSQYETGAGGLDDFRKSADLGYREANYHAAAHLLIRINFNKSENVAKDLSDSFKYQLAGAELGSSACIDQVQIAFRAQGDKIREHYWFLLERMGEGCEQVSQFVHFFDVEYTPDDRKFLSDVMSRLSLCGGEVKSKIEGLPGRSVLTSAYVDLYMRKQLNFVWHAFFDRDAPDSPLSEVYAGHRLLLRKESPISDLWMIVNKRYAGPDSKFQVSAGELMKNLLPGDEIVVRCGRLSHFATLWDIDRAAGMARVLDPFPQYWHPEQNRCVTVMKQVSYKHRRKLTQISLPELEKMLVAVLSIRDLQSTDGGK